jgi:hypothetical protein
MQKDTAMNPLESKEIRGLSVKNIITIVSCTVAIVSTVLGSWFNLKGELSALQRDRQSDEKYNDLRIKTIELKIETLNLDIRDLQNRQRGLQAEQDLQKTK